MKKLVWERGPPALAATAQGLEGREGISYICKFSLLHPMPLFQRGLNGAE